MDVKTKALRGANAVRQSSLMNPGVEDILVLRKERMIKTLFDILYYDPIIDAYVAAARGTKGNKDFVHSTGKDGLLGTIGSHGHDKLVTLRSIGIDWDGYIKQSTAELLTRKEDEEESLLEQWLRRIKNCEEGKDLYLSGHSLGSAIVQVYAILAILSGRFKTVYLDLYGTFPIFDQVAADAFNKDTRIVCNNFQYLSDPVPLMKSLTTALLYRNFLSLQMVQEFQRNDPDKLTKHVGKIWYGNFAPAHDISINIKPKLEFVWAHNLDSYMDGFLTTDIWAAWKEFQQNEGMIQVVRSSTDEERDKAVKDAEGQYLKSK
ncbi:uncharacterized protein N7500_000438 [Penicillium coprophilum]|uniref:uncharacterized protein n=1 Tax=Penicillium coprophilum TaxID=36646 RepID=UPI00238798DA|nr:uncharacterized protein N7500_000438 [Penicillium coprophilum]KAJ5177739.1 hypothetical protein N7500_000438 [Penicillium coprophilum]